MKTLALSVIGALALLAQAPKLDVPTNMKPYFLVLMKKGAHFVEPTTPAGVKLIGQHLTWIKQMNKDGKLVLAGPTGEGRYLGMSVLTVDSEEAARKLLDEEPEVKAGSMSYELQSVRLPDLSNVKIEYK